jgi:hypothetical protein
VCLRNSPTIQHFEKLFLKRTTEEILKNPSQQENGDLPGKFNATNQLKPKPNLT